MNTNPVNLSLSTTTNIKEFLKTYVKHWKWFLISVIIALALAFLHLRYSIPEYSAGAKIQILEDKNSTSELSLFKDLDVFSGAGSKIQDEIQIIKSRSNLIEVVKNLGLNIKVVAVGNILNSELYSDTPFKLNFIASDSIVHNSNFSFFINILSNATFGYTEKENIPAKIYSFGKTVSSPIGDIVITPDVERINNQNGKKFKVSVSPVAMVAQSYRAKLILSSAEFSNIINVSLNDPIKEKAKDIINSLIKVYNSNYIEDKKNIADRTSTFIDERINEIYSNLSNVDQSAEDFKSGRGLTDITSQSNINLNLGAANQRELQDASIQLEIISSMKGIVDSQNGYEILPSNVGISDASIANTTVKYNELVAERNRLLKSSNEKNPVIVNLDQKLASLKQSMQSNLNSATSNLNLKVNSLSEQLAQINSRIYSAPKNERALRDITRQQQTTEALYLYLLQKREESQITFASTAPKSRVIDNAFSSNPDPVSPKPKIVYLASFILGLLLPFSIIYADVLLDNKVHNRVGVEKLTKEVPVLAEIPKLSRRESKLIQRTDRSTLAESLRILRTNLDYLIKSKKGGGKKNVIFVTSSVSGEGKTFVSSNLAMIFASTNKKVLLVGADIRNPKLYNFFTNNKREKNTGLTEYLYDDSITTNEIINSLSVYENKIDVIYSGKIPPNPSELLMSGRIKSLFKEVSEIYDYVIVDTAPLMVVTDTLLISEYANQILYVTKAGVTENKVLEFPIKLKKEGKLKNLSFIVNNVKDSNLGYGGKYGYGYGKTMKKWWKF